MKKHFRVTSLLFFKPKSANEMWLGVSGTEMCIKARALIGSHTARSPCASAARTAPPRQHCAPRYLGQCARQAPQRCAHCLRTLRRSRTHCPTPPAWCTALPWPMIQASTTAVRTIPAHLAPQPPTLHHPARKGHRPPTDPYTQPTLPKNIND